MANTAPTLKDPLNLPIPRGMGALVPPPVQKSVPSRNPNGISSFGLNTNPFASAAVDGRVALTPGTRAAIGQLAQAIQARKGLLVLTGEVGTGKTTVLNQLRLWLAEKSLPAAFLFNPLLDTQNFFNFVLAEFGVRFHPDGPGNAFTYLSNWLFARYREGSNPVLIVDEAQGLAPAVLQGLVSALNLEMSGEKLLQVVLSGQPELNDKLRAPELSQLRQRIALRCRTSALSAEETHSYVAERLHAAGANGKPVFSEAALEATHFYACGIPRVINLLCEHALTRAVRRQLQPVPVSMIEEVAHEFELADGRQHVPYVSSEESLDMTLRAMRGAAPLNLELVSASAVNRAKNEPAPAHVSPHSDPEIPAAKLNSPASVSASQRSVAAPTQPKPTHSAVATPAPARNYPGRVTVSRPHFLFLTARHHILTFAKGAWQRLRQFRAASNPLSRPNPKPSDPARAKLEPSSRPEPAASVSPKRAPSHPDPAAPIRLSAPAPARFPQLVSTPSAARPANPTNTRLRLGAWSSLLHWLNQPMHRRP